MLSPHITSIIAQQHISELHRAAANHRLAHATPTVRQPDTEPRSLFARRLRRRLPDAQPVSR
jgi:hypothetical protein